MFSFFLFRLDAQTVVGETRHHRAQHSLLLLSLLSGGRLAATDMREFLNWQTYTFQDCITPISALSFQVSHISTFMYILFISIYK
jgi:hypothetical protein